ncbi:MAG: CNNM domain-containing protein [Candidatus Omnitrophota bacterium]|nr:CNNM domain-containing protein [Candidatus Omnitrophota bacterium]
MITLAFIFLLCVLFSAFFSGSEMAFVSANKLALRNRADSGDRAAKMIVKLQRQSHAFLTAVLLGNNIVNVTATAVLTLALQQYFGIESELVVTLLLAPVIIVFGEMVPKDYCRMRSQSFLVKNAGALNLFFSIFKHPARWISAGANLLLPRRHKSIFVSEREFRAIIEESTHAGVVSRDEKKMVDRILDFEKTHVHTVMIPLEEVSKVNNRATVGEVKEVARRSRAKMILVYEEIPSIIVGMIYVFDLLFEERNHLGLKEFLRSPIFLPQNTSLEKAFFTLQQKRQSNAVIIDRRGNVAGVVPIERLITL